MNIKKIAFASLGTLFALTLVVAFVFHRATGSFEIAVPESLKGDEAGDLVSVTRIGKYPAFAMKWALNQLELEDPIAVDYGIILYQLEYLTTAYDGSMVTASGLVTVPDTDELASVISYQHGTSTHRRNSPSQPGLGEGLLVSAAAGGSGHVLVAADYIGLGNNHEFQPYFHADTTASTCIDMLSASRRWLEHLGVQGLENLYLMGVSQGGHATLAIHRALERMPNPPFTVSASAPIVGAFQLRNISFPQAMTGTADSHEMYLGYLASAYAKIYGQPLTSILKQPYAESIPPVFNGDHSSSTIRAVLPELPREMFTERFLSSFDSGQSNWFLQALDENSVINWTPIAPVRLYYGDKDINVLPRESLEVEAMMNTAGADVTAISVGPYTHTEAALRAIPKALLWFNELSSIDENQTSLK